LERLEVIEKGIAQNTVLHQNAVSMNEKRDKDMLDMVIKKLNSFDGLTNESKTNAEKLGSLEVIFLFPQISLMGTYNSLK
jgi:hypothetical protein